MTAAMSPIRITVAEARQKLNLSQAELSRRASVSQSTISGIESGTTNGVDFGVLERLARALGIDNPLHLLEYVPETGKGRRGKSGRKVDQASDRQGGSFGRWQDSDR